MQEKKLDVRNLRISFRTVTGKLQAVRGISFDLKKGETLAIVGESGSGKSVTSKAIIGILAGNSIVEGGEIIYDGKDLLKIPEDEFYRIRGDKIAMIFQDPLSSLNPIMRIGRQLTEAMVLKGKARQKASARTLRQTFSVLRSYMELSGQSHDEVKSKCAIFDKFEERHIELEKTFDEAYTAATEALPDVENALFLIEKSAFDKDAERDLDDIVRLSLKSVSPYVVENEGAEAIKHATDFLRHNIAKSVHTKSYALLTPALTEIAGVLREALAKTKPNFFAMGYYVTFSHDPLPNLPVDELNVFMRRYLDDNFMLGFIADAERAVAFAAESFNEKKRTAISALSSELAGFGDGTLTRARLNDLAQRVIAAVEASIDPLEITKDSQAYTFASSLRTAISVYLGGTRKNTIEQRRYNRQKKKQDKDIAHGRKRDWKVTPPALVDMDLAKNNIRQIMERLIEHYTQRLSAAAQRDYGEETVAIIDWLKANAAGSVHKVSLRMAKHRALKLMEEVGIAEPRKRFKQYPFEFSGGMRQRIVIAIALAADPDILICDEPTTALDVTIQAQILELINKIKRERQLSIIFITHDLGVVANMADKIAVMYAGKIVEYGTSEDVFYSPAHPYTWALLSSMPDLDTNEKLEAIPGTPPNMIFPPKGDAFAERNKYAMKIDFEEEPPMFAISETHGAATWLLHPNAPKVEMPKLVTERISRMKKLGGVSDEE